jgi:hypothetical protein
VTHLVDEALHHRWTEAVVEQGERFGVLAQELSLRLWGRPADVMVTGEPAAEALLRGR